jgi:hypothetical protein
MTGERHVVGRQDLKDEYRNSLPASKAIAKRLFNILLDNHCPSLYNECPSDTGDRDPGTVKKLRLVILD